MKSQQLAVQRMERDLELLLRKYSKQEEGSSVKTLSKDQLIEFLGKVGVFKEVCRKKKDQRSVSPNSGMQAQRQTQRLKNERSLLFNLWNCILNPFLEEEVQLEIATEILKILFNHYIPNNKQVKLISEFSDLME